MARGEGGGGGREGWREGKDEREQNAMTELSEFNSTGDRCSEL